MRNDLSAAFEATAITRIIEEIPKAPDHKFSRSYRRKMKELWRRSRCALRCGGGLRFDKVPLEKGSFKKVSLKRLFTYALIAALLAALTSLSAGAARELFKKFFMTSFDTHTVVRSADYENAPETIEDIYVITNIPNELELTYKDDITENSPSICYDYSKDDLTMFYVQSVKKYYNSGVNTENHPMSYIEINGYEGYIIDMGDNNYYISWDNGDYIFDIMGNIGKNSLIEAAESVQKVEN